MPPRDNLSGLLFYAFRYRDSPTGKWKRARYKAERHVIAERFTEWETIGSPEIRHGADWGAGFNPTRGLALRPPK